MIAKDSNELRKLISKNPNTLPSLFLNDNTLSSFLYDEKTIKELKKMLNRDPDTDDCQKWGLTKIEWRINVELALIAITARQKSGDKSI